MNLSKIRKDRDPIEDIDVPLDPVGLHADHSANISQEVSHADSSAEFDRDPALKIINTRLTSLSCFQALLDSAR